MTRRLLHRSRRWAMRPVLWAPEQDEGHKAVPFGNSTTMLYMVHVFDKLRTRNGDFFIATLWLFNITMEHGPFIDDFPAINLHLWGIFHGYVSHNQMVWLLQIRMNTTQVITLLIHEKIRWNTTWWFVPLSKWFITPFISWLTLLISLITGVKTH